MTSAPPQRLCPDQPLNQDIRHRFGILQFYPIRHGGPLIRCPYILQSFLCMTDYHEHHYSGHDPHPYRGAFNPSVDEDVVNRSITRGSHQSQASVSASTRSWVMSTQANPPPPPMESTISSSSKPVRVSRPLPDPHFRQSRVPVNYGLANEHFENTAPQEYAGYGVEEMRGFPFGYSDQITGRVVPEAVVSPPPFQSLKADPNKNQSFVGGFFKGFKRLPKMFKGGSKGDSRKLQRKGTFGTEATSPSATAMDRGNTLPRYLSNPSIGPSNPQFAHRLSRAITNGTLPPGSIPVQYLRNNPAGPQHPVLTVTAPSDEIVGEEHADFYDGPTSEYPQLPDILENEPGINGRTATVMIYNTDSQAPTIPPTTATGPPPTRRATATPTARVSYQSELPTRATVEAQTDPMRVPTPHVPLSPMHNGGLMQPAMHQSPNDVLSPPTTSRYTMSTTASRYDPSFASDLGPIEKFFKGLYHLPWVAPDRVTVDYRPGDSDRARKKVKRGLKKPMASWYRAILTRSRASRDLDLLSSGAGTVNSISQLGSPISRRSGRSSGHRRAHTGQAKHRKHRRRVISDATTDTQQQPLRSTSPIIPAPYPYAYPAMYQYPYPYNPYMPVPQVVPRGPRTHNRRKASKYPAGGYANFQPMAMPPPQPMPPPGAPIYFITPSPPQSQTGPAETSDQAAAQKAHYQPQGPMQISPVVMHYVPGAYNPNNPNNPTMISPPLTPQRHAAHAPS